LAIFLEFDGDVNHILTFYEEICVLFIDFAIIFPAFEKFFVHTGGLNPWRGKIFESRNHNICAALCFVAD